MPLALQCCTQLTHALGVGQASHCALEACGACGAFSATQLLHSALTHSPPSAERAVRPFLSGVAIYASEMGSNLTDAEYLAKHSDTFEAAFGRCVAQVVSERAPDPVDRLSELLAVRHDEKLTLPSAVEDHSTDQWSLPAWARGAGVHRVIAAALLRGVAPGADALAMLKGLKGPGELAALLRTTALVGGLVDLLWPEVEKLQAAGEATGEKIQCYRCFRTS